MQLKGKSNHHKFLVLDGMRGIAAVAVMLYHCSESLLKGQVPWLPDAFFAVDFFFVLSGFVIGHAYEKRLLKADKVVVPFMLVRLIRLYPLYWLAVTLSFIFVLSSPEAPLKVLSIYLPNVLFIPVQAPPGATGIASAAFPLDVAAWSLSLEIGVNFLYAVICRHLSNFRLFILISACGVLIGLTAAHFQYLNIGWSGGSYWGGWARALWSFFTGIFIFRLVGARQSFLSPWVGLFLAIGLLALLTESPFAWREELPVILILLPLLVLVGAMTKSWAPAHRLYAWLGRSSYSVYILHMPMLPILTAFAEACGLHPLLHTKMSIVIYGCIILAIATVADGIWDARLRNEMTKRFRIYTEII